MLKLKNKCQSEKSNAFFEINALENPKINPTLSAKKYMLNSVNY